MALAAGTHPEVTAVAIGISLVSLGQPAAPGHRQVPDCEGARQWRLRADSVLTGVGAALALISLVGLALTEVFGLTAADAMARWSSLSCSCARATTRSVARPSADDRWARRGASATGI
jgi:hypothetical protein